MSDYINLIGVEIEGRWQEMPPVGELDYDGSVEFIVEEEADPPPPPPGEPEPPRQEQETVERRRTGMGRLGETIDPDGPLIGEAVSDPMQPESAPEWIERNYPDEVNQTCGLHVHMSLMSPYYQRLMDEAFWEYSLEQLESWGNQHDVPPRFFDRLNGNNGTCRRRWHPDEQMHGGHDTRYSIWNFHAYRAHDTAECRVFPAFETPDLASEAVLFTCHIVRTYLDNYEPEPLTFEATPKPMSPITETL